MLLKRHTRIWIKNRELKFGLGSKSECSVLRPLRKAVHAPCPLKGDDAALDRLNHRHRQNERKRRPQDRLPAQWDFECMIDLYHRRNEDMAEQQYNDIGRKVVGLMSV